jgi:8-oxo-dGTP pyrophosphatase MutT (NUDIX family)
MLPYNPPMPFRPNLTVAAIVQQHDRFLLVEERIKGSLVLNQPAGHVEDGETILEAVVRETMEEAAWQFVPRHLVGFYLWRDAVTAKTTLRIAILGDAVRHDAGRTLDRGIQGTHWLTRNTLLAQTERLRSPLVLRCVDDCLAGRRYDLDALNHIGILPVAQSA